MANQTLTGLFIDSTATIPHAENSSAYRPEAGAVQKQASRTWGLTYDAILSSRWLGTAQFGHTPASLSVNPMSGGGTIGTINLDNTIRVPTGEEGSTGSGSGR